MNLYNNIKLKKILIFFIILDTINYEFMTFNNILYNKINIIKLLYLIISISGLYIAFDITKILLMQILLFLYYYPCQIFQLLLLVI